VSEIEHVFDSDSQGLLDVCDLQWHDLPRDVGSHPQPDPGAWVVSPGGGGTDARNPRFSYTVGLSRLDHPEIITFGMCPECAYEAIEPLAAAVLAGRRFDEGDDVTDLYRERYPDPPPPQLLRFPDSSTHLLVANDMYALRASRRSPRCTSSGRPKSRCCRMRSSRTIPAG
jgi:Domain of unknown function (DUF4262)